MSVIVVFLRPLGLRLARLGSFECESQQQNFPVAAVAIVDVRGGDVMNESRLYKLFGAGNLKTITCGIRSKK